VPWSHSRYPQRQPAHTEQAHLSTDLLKQYISIIEIRMRLIDLYRELARCGAGAAFIPVGGPSTATVGKRVVHREVCT